MVPVRRNEVRMVPGEHLGPELVLQRAVVDAILQLQTQTQESSVPVTFPPSSGLSTTHHPPPPPTDQPRVGVEDQQGGSNTMKIYTNYFLDTGIFWVLSTSILFIRTILLL